jgi:hypothetical protein
MLISNAQLTGYTNCARHKKQNRLQHDRRLKDNEHVRCLAIIDNGDLVRLDRCVIDDCAVFNFW